ncbi:MAG: HDOD domain-containing protein [Desulfobacula sp.]|uniref:HDOD domain-containing protein n=1 Tax=Desulfobacula sp. TaxID=2593537 RepID=UPI0025C27370|nr:HDOD domain-containing protein [Desulfobacula sp.]MCD4722497.1 HDOD domain-containing protein [Desulfobacula sp.]
MEIKTQILKMIQKKDSDLPTLPVVVDRIISVASDEKTTTEELAQVISYDQGMTNKLLKLSNSIYYAQKTKVETIKRAITIIGFDEIIGIALGMGILSSFTDKSSLSLDMKALWIHGIGVATASKELAKRTNPGIANKIFIPALLHDMGKVIYSIYFRDEYMKVRQLATEKKKPLYFAENAVFKLDHAILSALLMKRWNFPQSIVLPCRFHHNPESAPIKFRHQSLIINLADYLTQKAGIGHSGNPVPVTIKNSPKKIGVNQSILKLTIDQLKRKEGEIKEFFNITTEV